MNNWMNLKNIFLNEQRQLKDKLILVQTFWENPCTAFLNF